LSQSCEIQIGIDEARSERRERAAALLTMLTVTVDDTLLDEFPNLRVVSNMAVGVDNVDVEACTRRGLPVGNTPGVLTDATADLTWALLLAAARRIVEAATDAREGRWQQWTPDGWLGTDLRACVLGIIGMGKIGYAVAQRARGFGMRLIYCSRSGHPEAEDELGARRASLEELLAQSDFVSLHCPLTPETTGLINQAALRRMKTSAYLINTSRGAVVDQDALVAALDNHSIAGAALDVTTPEPLPSGHPLYGLANCVVAPHVGSATRGTRQKMARLACENILAALAGDPLPHCVNPAVYA
jgi:lactate dehydrogenase-like 2-hydroxyacid dehydrogenase